VQNAMLALRALNKELHVVDMWEPDARLDPAQIIDPNARAGRTRRAHIQRQADYAPPQTRIMDEGVDALRAWVEALSPDVRKLWNQAAEEAFSRDQTVMERFTELMKAFTESENAVRRQREAEVERQFNQRVWEESQKGINAAGGPIQAALTGGGASGFFSSLTGMLTTAIGDATSGISLLLQNLFKTTSAATGPIGAIIALIVSIVGPALAALQPVVDLLESVGKFVGHIVNVGLLPLLNTLRPLNSAIELLGVAIGFLIRDLVTDALPILELLIWAIAGAVKIISAVIITLSPLVALILHVITTIGTFGIWLLAYLSPVEMGAGALADALRSSTITILDAARNLHNGLLSMIRQIPGLETFGDWFTWDERNKLLEDMGLKKPDGDDDPNKDNTEATRDNTQAIRDLAREFRNLPSGYKIASADYATSRPGAGPGLMNAGTALDEPGAGFLGGAVSMRDFFRGRR
jgi:hypothetical protein